MHEGQDKMPVREAPMREPNRFPGRQKPGDMYDPVVAAQDDILDACRRLESAGKVELAARVKAALGDLERIDTSSNERRPAQDRVVLLSLIRRLYNTLRERDKSDCGDYFESLRLVDAEINSAEAAFGVVKPDPLRRMSRLHEA